MPLVVHCWADLQSVHGLRCYGNITRTLVTSLRPPRDDNILRTRNVSECSVLALCLVYICVWCFSSTLADRGLDQNVCILWSK